jgi:hypothetical protein
VWGEVRDRSKRSTDQLNEAYLRAAARPSVNEGWTAQRWVGGGGKKTGIMHSRKKTLRKHRLLE